MAWGNVRGRRAAAGALTVGVLLIASISFGGGSGAGAALPCDKFASPLGLDAQPGTELLPFRTAQKLADSLAPGETGCLKAGTYGNLAVRHGGSSGRPVTVQSFPGQRAIVVGRVSVASGADFVTIADLDLVGLNAFNLASPSIDASHVTLQGNDITNAHTADCVFVGSWEHTVTGVAITGNRIHNCGRLPSINRHQAISVWNATDTEVSGNVVYDNADRGIQLYPNAQRTHVAENTVDGNGEGVMISGTGGFASSDNVIERNVITNSKIRDNVESYWPEGNPVGQGNVVRDNCVSGGVRDNGDGGIAKLLDGVTVSGNLVADPGYVNRAGKDFRLQSTSQCLAILTGVSWRAFSDSSPWNVPAAQKGTIYPDNPYADQFSDQGASFRMKVGGTPNNPTYTSPIFFAETGDPLLPVSVTLPGWAPTGDTRWDGNPVPLPADAFVERGSDGHMTIVSADRKTAWEFWRAQIGAAGLTTSIIVQFDLTGPGYSSDRFDDTSARGSGAPLIATTLRADEAVNGIRHALGITVPRVGSSYLYPPATHTDGGGDASSIKYGMLFVLRSDYPVPSNASIGLRNLIQALKTYGAYVVDQGANFQIDSDSNQPQLWQKAGLRENTPDFTANDFRYVHTGAAEVP
jgi:parallel beta-helix repeat protein